MRKDSSAGQRVMPKNKYYCGVGATTCGKACRSGRRVRRAGAEGIICITCIEPGDCPWRGGKVDINYCREEEKCPHIFWCWTR